LPTAADIYYHAYEGTGGGKHPPVVLIHGAGGNHLYWPSQIRRLTGLRVFAPDLPGHGKSGGCGEQLISAYANAILNWQQAVDIHQAVLVGSSMGSAIALHLALEHPEHVAGIALIGGGARLSVNPILLQETSQPTTYHNAIERLIHWYFSPQTPEELIQVCARRMGEIRYSVLNGDLKACDSFDVTDRLGDIYQPTLILCGADDKMTPPRLSQYLARNIPNAQLTLIERGGHMVMLEHPGLVARYISRFAQDIPH